MANFPFFKMAAVRHLIHLAFYKLEILTSDPVLKPIMCHCAKFREDRSNRSGYMTDFSIFKIVAIRHLEFSTFGNFNFRSGLEVEHASLCQISRISVKKVGDMADFLFSN